MCVCVYVVQFGSSAVRHTKAYIRERSMNAIIEISIFFPPNHQSISHEYPYFNRDRTMCRNLCTTCTLKYCSFVCANISNIQRTQRYIWYILCTYICDIHQMDEILSRAIWSMLIACISVWTFHWKSNTSWIIESCVSHCRNSLVKPLHHSVMDYLIFHHIFWTLPKKREQNYLFFKSNQ